MGCVGVCVGSGYLAGAVGDERGVEVPVAALEVTRLRFGFWDRQGGCGGLRVYVSGLSVSPIPPYIYTHMHTHKALSLSIRLSLSLRFPLHIYTHIKPTPPYHNKQANAPGSARRQPRPSSPFPAAHPRRAPRSGSVPPACGLVCVWYGGLVWIRSGPVHTSITSIHYRRTKPPKTPRPTVQAPP